METLDQLTQRLADEAYQYEAICFDGKASSATYYAVSRTIREHAEEIAKTWNLENLRSPHPEQMDVDALAARVLRDDATPAEAERVLSAMRRVKAAADGTLPLFSCQGQAMSGIEELANYRALLAPSDTSDAAQTNKSPEGPDPWLALDRALAILRREPENFGEAQAILLDAFEIVKEAVDGA